MKLLALVAILATGAFVPVLHTGDTVPALPLVDQDGRAFSFASLRGHVAVVSFVYTRCSDARECPLIAAKFAKMQRVLRDASIRLVLLTLDPEYDTPRVLHAYGTVYHQNAARWTLATGNPTTVAELEKRLGVSVTRDARGELEHTESAVVVDREGGIAKVVDGADWSTDDMLALAQNVAGQGLSPLATVRVWLTSAVEVCGGRSVPITAGLVIALIVLFTAAFGYAMRRAIRT